MGDVSRMPVAPAARDVVEIVDPLSGARVTAVVETASNSHYVLRFDRGAAVPREARIRWYDGDAAWHATSRLEPIDETSASFELTPARDWQRAPVRRSLRAPVGNISILVRIASSMVLETERSVHAVCLDISDSGCRAKWTGPKPAVEDRVEVAWDVGNWKVEAEPGWVSARVARVVASPFGGSQVAFTFEAADPTQAARVRAWHQGWLQAQRQRALDDRAV
jgi:hypothetical protein